MRTLNHETGHKFRPVAVVGKIAQEDGKILTLYIRGDRYVLDDSQRRKERKAYERSVMEREVLLSLLKRKGVELKRPHEMKLEVLRRILIEGEKG